MAELFTLFISLTAIPEDYVNLMALTTDFSPSSRLVNRLFRLLSSLVLSLLFVDVVQTLGLNSAVDEGTRKTGKQLLGLLVRSRLP